MFGLIVFIITLPFTLLRMAFGILGISTHILMLPLKIFARHTVLCLVLIGIAILYFSLKSNPQAIDQLKPAAPQDRQAKTPAKGAPPIIEKATKFEDGDSVFATDTYNSMTEPERAKYSEAFYTAMSRTADGEVHNWSYYNINGSLKPTRTFRNGAGDTCRAFEEVLKVHKVQQTLTGTACDNGGGAWCKLKPNATPACGLSGEPSGFDSLSNSIKNLF